MRPEHHGNTHTRLLRKTVLGNTVAAIPKRGKKVAKPKNVDTASVIPKGSASPKSAPAGNQAKDRHRAAVQARTEQANNEGAVEREQDRARTKTGNKQRGSRFVGPTHLDKMRKAQIAVVLKANGIGDEIGRQIFIGALEYQLSTFGEQLQRRGDERPPDPRPRPRPQRHAAADEALRVIGEQTRLLAERLRALSEPAEAELTLVIAALDRRDHGYDEQYLSELAAELERLEQACTCTVDTRTKTEEPAEDPTPSRNLVAKLASIFAECFEREPTAEPGGQFQTLLAVLDEETGLVIGRDPKFLEDILG